jgi:hypothetical protein
MFGMMELVKFMNAHKQDWQNILSAEPYNIKISSAPAINGAYYLLKYNQLSSDFNLAFCREARGCIMYFDNLAQRFECVCHPFDKFGNYGESYVPEIDWKSAKVTEKVDGSLIKVWYHGGWHISTNGTINAQYAYVPNSQLSYYDLFLRAIRRHGTVESFFQALDLRYTYLFELVSPDNRMTIYYPEDAIYLIGKRNNLTHAETKITPFCKTNFDIYYSSLGVRIPRAYSLASLEECIEATKAMGADEEGFVVCDADFNRVKVKSEQYLIASHLRFNNSINVKKVIKLIREEMIDDFCAYNEDYIGFVNRIKDAGRKVATLLDEAWENMSKLLPATKKEFYQMVKESPFADFYLKKYDNKYPITGKDWLDRQSLDEIIRIIEEELN